MEGETLQAVRDYRSVLVNLDPADVSGFLAAAEKTQDLLCLSLLAVVWDPDVAKRLSILFEGFSGRQYAAGDVRSALQTALAELDADDSSRRHHLDAIRNIGGAGRFFGLKQLCKRLGVTSGGAPKPVRAKARGGPLQELLAWSKEMQGRVTAAVRQAKRDKEVLPLLQALEKAISVTWYRHACDGARARASIPGSTS